MSCRARPLPRALLAAAVVVVSGVASGGAFAAGETLTLRRGNSRVSSLDFYLSGARPNDEILFALVSDRRDDSQLTPLDADPRRYTVLADARGNAHVHLAADAVPAASSADRPVYLRAYVGRSDGHGELVTSNAVPLVEPSLLHLVVADANATARTLVFDPTTGTLDDERHDVDVDSPLALCGTTSLVKSGGALHRLDGGDSVLFAQGEVEIDHAVTPDQSLAVALTRETLSGGRELLRLRVLESTRLSHELGSLEVLRSSSRVAKAWLVTGDDSHRVVVVERNGLVREVVLGTELTRGVTMLPMAPDGSDELVDVRIVDDQLVALTRSVARRRAPESRVVSLDLHAREGTRERVVPGRAVALEVALRGERPTAFVALESGRVEVLELDGPARAAIDLPGVARLVVAGGESGHDRLYALSIDAADRSVSIVVIDVESLTRTSLDLPAVFEPESAAPALFGVFGAPDPWLYLVERATGDGGDQLHCWKLDPESGLLLDSAGLDPVDLRGKVLRAAAR